MPSLRASLWVINPLEVSRIMSDLPIEISIVLSVFNLTLNRLEGVLINLILLKKVEFL